MIYEVKSSDKIKQFFNNWNETLIWSCMQGVMGHLYVTNESEPDCVIALLGDFCFVAGKPNQELIVHKPKGLSQEFVIMVPQTKEWEILIEEVYEGRLKKVERYAIKKEMDIFDKEKLRNVVECLPDNYALKMIDEELFVKCKEMEWCRDWVAQYDTYEQYQKYGLGVVLFVDGELVSGASSYSGYLGGIEIEIDTHKDYRRKGYAYICASKLILECLERNLYPSWDAQNLWSVALAEKLGYHFDHAYTAYEIDW